MKPYVLPADRVTYNYRYFLPYAPEWGSDEFCGTRLRELLTYCDEAGIDAVQFFVNILPGTYYMPAHSAKEQERWADWMGSVVRPALEGIGVSYQLNFQCLLGHGTFGIDMRDEFDWGYLVSHRGDEALGCPCPLDDRFRAEMGEMLHLWASTLPDVIWVDDDFRMHNHGQSDHGLDFYCYCKTHLSAFADRMGRAYTREEIVSEVLRPGEPSALRLDWNSFIADTMVDTAAWIRERVSSVSPDIRIALMTSSPDIHSIEGRDWKRTLTALSGEHPPMTRPMCGIYTGTTAPVKNFVCTYRYFDQSIATLDTTLGRGVAEYGPELENTRFTTWCKSVANSRFVLTLAQLVGCPQITLSINDLDGSPINEEPTSVSMLRDIRPRLETLAGMRLYDWRAMGAALVTDPESGRKARAWEGASYTDLGFNRCWDDLILQMGVPTRYVDCNGAAESGAVVFVDGATGWLLSDEQLRKALAGAVMVDGFGAAILQERGFGRYLGVKVVEKCTYGIHAEQYLDGVLPGVYSIRVPHRGYEWYEMEIDGGKLASEFIDPKNRRHVGSAVFENKLGGRVVVYASLGELIYGHFGSHARQRWLQGSIRWLSRYRFPALPQIPHHCLTVARSSGSKMLLAIANLGTDALDGVRFRLGAGQPSKHFRVLQEDGTWSDRGSVEAVALETGEKDITIPGRIGVFEWLITVLE